MHARRLLIVDGDSLRTPGMLKAFSEAGWHVDWVSLLQLQLDFLPEGVPDALLVAPAALATGDTGLSDLKSRFPGVPIVGGKDRRTGELPSGLQEVLDLESDPAGWPALFQAQMKPAPTPAPAAAKWSTEDLFGDIVAELEGRAPTKPVLGAPPAPAPTAPRATVPKPPSRPAGMPALPKPPAPAAPRPAAPRPEPAGTSPEPAAVSEPIDLPPLPAQTVTPTTSISTLGDELRAILGEGLASAPPKPVEEEFTLSGISGIHDPFVVPPVEEEPVQAAPPVIAEPVIPPPEPVKPVSLPGRNPLLDSLQMPILEEFGNYYLMEKIAVGGMAELFKARQRGVHDFQKIVAIKRILPHLSDNDEFVRMFIDEAKLAAQLTHPNIAQIFDLGRVSGFYYIAMEFVDGRDLRSMLRKVRDFGLPFPEPIAAFVVMKVAGALDYAHRKRGMDDRELKLVHRDVSPQNVLISNEGAVKLVDFGIAKAATKSTQTVAGALKGKLLYMSPEQALGEPLDHRSDIFSLGLVLFELLTGERCFQADSELGVLEKVRLGKVTAIRTLNPRVSDGMVAILERALAKDLDKRYSAARFMERDLRALLARHGSGPTEHDVADFTGTLLKGTREQVELQISTHFPPPSESPSGPVSLEDTPTTAPRIQAPGETMPERPIYESPAQAAGGSRWIMPAVMSVILLLLIGLWFILNR